MDLLYKQKLFLKVLMERLSTKKLPPIFKMSALWNILPYYGHIHRWRRLLEKINTETKDIWDQNREQLKYIGKDFKREIEVDKLKKNASHLRPNRSWIDLLSLSLSYNFYNNNFDFTILSDNLSKDEVIVIDSHDDIFKAYQIYFWSKDTISDILPAIECPSFKSETKILKASEKKEIRKIIEDQSHIKSIVIENIDEELSINPVYGESIKIIPSHLDFLSYKLIILEKLKERYKLWEIGDCACKPKKIRVEVNNFKGFWNTIEELGRFSNINDVKLGINLYGLDYDRTFSDYDSMFFNHSATWMGDYDTKFMFTGDTLAVVYKGNYYNFRLDQRTKDSEYNYINGKI